MNAITATATTTAAEIQMGIEHAALVIAQWDAACEDETVATDADVAAAQERVIKMFAEINAMTTTTVEQATKSVPTPTVRKVSESWLLRPRTSAFSGRGSEPAAKKTAAPATQAEPAITGPTLLLDNEEQRAFFAQWNARVDALAKQDEAWEATHAPTEADMEAQALEAYKYTLEHPSVDQERYFAIWAPSQTNDKKRYGLLCLRTTGLAVDCSCMDRVKKGRFQGRACKHQTSHNAMLAKPAQNATQAA
jgi:hypothetical protein